MSIGFSKTVLVDRQYNQASTQAWPSFVDILSSTIVVLCFALLIVVIVLSVSSVTTTDETEREEASPSEILLQSNIVSQYMDLFQKLEIIAEPTLSKDPSIEADVSNLTSLDSSTFVPDPSVTNRDQKVREPGESSNPTPGDIPLVLEVKSLEVLKELVVIQQNVIVQQRKVIEQQDQEIADTTREYQSLLSLVVQNNEVEDIRQEIIPKDDQLLFLEKTDEGEKLSGPSDQLSGDGFLALNPPVEAKSNVSVLAEGADSIVFAFSDNAAFLSETGYELVLAEIADKIDIWTEGVEIEVKISGAALSVTRGQKIAVDRLLIFRSLLMEAGIPANRIKLRSLSTQDEDDDLDNGENYGWIRLQAGSN